MRNNQQRFYVDIMQEKSEVTGSFILGIVKIREKTIKFAVDCGLYQENDYDERNLILPTNPDELNYVLLTHNHTDHNGRLPYLVKQGFRENIYTTEITNRMLGHALYDSSRIIGNTSKRSNSTALYSDIDVANTIKLTKGCEYNKPYSLCDNLITVTFLPNGHIVGSASILVQIHCPGEHKDINLLFTGDYSGRNMFYKVAPIRKWITELPINIIIESTYGDMDSSAIKEVFVRNVLNALIERKTVVVPVFSLGRAQEILYIIKKLQIKNPELFNDIPIYYDGKLSFYYTEMYKNLLEEGLLKFYKTKRDFLPSNLIKVEDKVLRREIISPGNYKSKIILTTSGMGSYGPAQTYIPAYIGRTDAVIHFTGYCAENTLGYNLKNTSKDEIVEVGGIKVIKKADVESTNEFSAHAKSDELIKYINKFQKPLFVMVNHGKDSSKDKFADAVLRETNVSKVGILGRDFFYRIDSNGLVKSLSTHFL